MSSNRLSSHSWDFVPTGGLDQVSLSTADDLLALGELDQKLWVALSCPVQGLQIDERTLTLIDSDGDGHVRPPEVIAAVTWACARLKDPGLLLKGADPLPLDAIATGAEGAPIADAARWILSRLGSAATAVTAEQAVEVARSVSQGALKGDGVLRPEAASDEGVRTLIKDIIQCQGKATEETVAAFYADLASFKAWSEAAGSTGSATLGPAAAEAFAAVAAVRTKVADYFARTQLAAFDANGIAGLNLYDEDFRKLALGELAADSPALVAFPLARIEPSKPLPLLEGVNPAWAAALARLHRAAVVPLLGAGKTALTPGDWSDLSEQLRPYESWIGTKPSSPVANLGAARINVILAGTGRKALEDLLSEDKVLAPKVAALADVERLALLSRDLGALLRNFVNFSDFYSRARPAVFQVGTLYLDSRSCRLCIRVDDIASHATFATMSRVFVTYLECRRPSGETMKIAAGFTQGDSDYLFVGRNGVFYDRRGRDWDATIVKIVASPISIRQSFWAPYKKVASFVGDQFSKFSASKDKIAATGLNKAVTAAATEAVQVVQPVPPPSPPSSFDIAKFAGIFAAVGLAVSAIGVALAAVFKGIENMPLWEKPLVVVVLLLLISGPSMLIAFLRLRQRTLGPLLEGTGWAVNGRVKINVPLGKALTDRGVLPPDSRRLAYDPYEDEAAKSRRYAVIGFAIAILVWLAAARVFRLWPF
jgi:hypothetical protein